MDGIVFVPGIFGSQLYYNDANNQPIPIWPPSLFDAIKNEYQEFDELADPTRVTVGGIVDEILVLPFYSPIESDLTDIANQLNNGAPGTYLSVPYDWRVDLFTAARVLEQQVTQWAAGGGLASITFFGHSMGGLVIRLLLECVIPGMAPERRPAWVPLVKRALFACTPHLGAPQALALGIGVEGDETLTGPQCHDLSANPAFPSAYELFPAPSRSVLFDQKTASYVPYDRSDVAAALKLNPANLAAAARVRGELNVARRTPAEVEYFFVYGVGSDTVETIDLVDLTSAGATIVQLDDGDGTVPSWSITEAASAASPPIPTWSGVGTHLGLLATDGFRQELYRYFGLGSSALSLRAVVDGAVSVQANKRQFAAGAAAHVLLIPSQASEKLSGTVRIQRVIATETPKGTEFSLSPEPVATKRVSVEGGPIKSHSVHIVAPSAPGAYQLSFVGEDGTALSDPKSNGWFFVRNDHDNPTRGLKPRSRRP